MRESGARMRFGVRFLQTLDRYVRVNLRGRETGVAQERLHAAQVRATIEHVGRKTVAKFVRTDRNRNRRVPQITFQDQPDRAWRNPFPGFTNEERSGMHVRGLSQERGPTRCKDRHLPRRGRPVRSIAIRCCKKVP
jgi:hypothetical protein